MEGKEVWAASELQADGAGREMDALSISSAPVTEKGKKSPDLRVQGVKRELAEPRLWSRAGHGSERCNLVLGKETQPWEVPGISVELGTSRFEGRSRTGVYWEALPARKGDPTLSWGLGWDGDPLQGRRDPCPTDRGISQGLSRCCWKSGVCHYLLPSVRDTSGSCSQWYLRAQQQLPAPKTRAPGGFTQTMQPI